MVKLVEYDKPYSEEEIRAIFDPDEVSLWYDGGQDEFGSMASPPEHYLIAERNGVEYWFVQKNGGTEWFLDNEWSSEVNRDANG